MIMKKGTKRCGGILYSWFISYMMIFSIPIMLSIVLQTYTNNLLKSELYNLEKEAILQMKYICDGELESIRQRVASITKEGNVRRFLNDEENSGVDEKINTKAVFDFLKTNKAQDDAIEDIYLFSEKNGYMISTRHGANAQDTALFSYEKVFGESRESFWEILKNSTKSTLVFEDQYGNSSIYLFSVIVTDDIRNPTGYILVSCQLGDKIFSDSNERLGGIVVDDGWVWDIRNHRVERGEIGEVLMRVQRQDQIKADGDKYLVTKEMSDSENWDYYYGIETGRFFRDLNKSRYLYGGFFVLSLLICVVVAYYLARKNFNPVLRLAESIQKERLDNMSQSDITFQYLEESYRELSKERYMLKNQLEKEWGILANNVLNRILKGYYKEEAELDLSLESYHFVFPYDSYRLILW